jgi:hypothetical protein
MGESVHDINIKIKETYGCHIETGDPKFRISWTTDQFEKRYEEFEVFTESGAIYLRTEKGVSQVPKYSHDHRDMWVLERLLPTVGNPYLEMVCKYSYEPLWIFGVGNSDRTPIWRAVKLLIDNAIFGDPNYKPLSPSDLVAAEEKRMKQEKIRAKQFLQDQNPIIPTIVSRGEGIYLDHPNFEKKGSGK